MLDMLILMVWFWWLKCNTYTRWSLYMSAVMLPAMTITLRQEAPYRCFWFL